MCFFFGVLVLQVLNASLGVDLCCFCVEALRYKQHVETNKHSKQKQQTTQYDWLLPLPGSNEFCLKGTRAQHTTRPAERWRWATGSVPTLSDVELDAQGCVPY